ncbi:RHS repeat-associated core domain-containing protein [Candidatus Parcubacteria bacterium]|nr:MAG: RHS repeat-associated core domain-containing protein [Candidatus Parcubacteria bacterium]
MKTPPGEVRYLLSDGLGSIRQAVDETGAVVAYQEFDPYGNPVSGNGGEPYGFTGEWWRAEVGLLHLRARWYAPEVGVFVSRDAVESEPPYQYVRENPVNRVDPRGAFPEALLRDSYGDTLVKFWQQQDPWWWEIMLEAEHGDVLISSDKKQIAQFVLDDPLLSAYQNIWEIHWPWSECSDSPLKSPIKLEGFTPDGRFWSETSPIFAEIWRQNTGSFFYTGLHPNDPTWGQFIYYSQNPALRPYMDDYQYPIFWTYWASLQTRSSHVLQHVATGLDAGAVGLSVIQTVAIDTAGILLIGGGCSGGPEGCVAGAAAAGAVNVGVSAGVGVFDIILGTLSLGATAGSDYWGGYTTIAEGKTRIGEGTVHTTITLAEGAIPETHVQLYANIKQLLYDFGVDEAIDLGLLEWKAIEID